MAPPDQLSAPALAGQNVIQVTNQAEFAVGEIIVIDAGTPIEETRTIVGFSSIILDRPLLFDHSVTSPVQKQLLTTAAPGLLTTTGTRTTTTAAPGPTTAAPGLLTTLAPGLLTTAAPGLLTTLAPGLLTTAAPGLLVTLSPGNPCAPVTTPQPAPANPCGTFARLSDGEGTAGKKTQKVTLSPVNPCAPVTTPQLAPANPCGTFARLADAEGTAGKKTQRSAFSVVNIGILGFCALCVAGIALGVKKIKRSKETLSYRSLPSQVGVPGDVESGALQLLAEAPME